MWKNNTFVDIYRESVITLIKDEIFSQPYIEIAVFKI